MIVVPTVLDIIDQDPGASADDYRAAALGFENLAVGLRGLADEIDDDEDPRPR